MILSLYIVIHTSVLIKTVAGELRRYLTPLSELQKEILNRLGLDLSLYLQLEIINSQNLLSEW